jgi:CBS domain-containing protein
MNTNHVRRLPVVDEDGRLAGIVSRRDLLSVFLRPDDDITHDTRQVLDELPLADPKDVIVAVRHGVVTLTGTLRPGSGDDQDLLPLALRLIWDIDGVVDVVNRLGEASAAKKVKTA